VNFDRVSTEFIRLSMPGKVAEYVLSGTPILVYGPPNVAQVASALGQGWAQVVSHRDPIQLSAAINALLTDALLRDRLARRARQVGLELFNLPVQRTRFEQALTALVSYHGDQPIRADAANPHGA